MKRLAALITGTALLAGGLSMAAPAMSASTTWTFPDATFTVNNGVETATISYQNLRIDGASATGTVRAAAGRWSCSTSSFTGLSANFFLNSIEPCQGTVSFSVDSTGALTVESSLTISSSPFGGPVGTAQASNKPAPKITQCTVVVTGDNAVVTWSSEGSPSSFSVGVVNSQQPNVDKLATDTEASLSLKGEPAGQLTIAIELNNDDTLIFPCPDFEYSPAPGAPRIANLVPAQGGVATISYDVAEPRSVVQGVEYSLDGGSWTRSGGSAPTGGIGGSFSITGLPAGPHSIILRTVNFGTPPLTTSSAKQDFDIPSAPSKNPGAPRPSQATATTAIGSTSTKPVPVPPVAPVSQVPGISNGVGTGTNGALAANTGDAGIDAPCLAEDGTLYPTLYSTVGSQLTMAPNTKGMGRPTAFTVVDGALPEGIQMDRAFGVLFGVPTQAGSWTTTVRVRFANGTTKDGQFTTRIDGDPQTLQYASQNIGSVGTGISIAPSTNAPVTGTTYALVCGELPAGTTLDPRTGHILGKPTSAVSLPVPLRVAQTSSSGKAAASFIFIVNKAGTHHLSYPPHPHVRPGQRVTIRPTVSGVGDIAEYRTSIGKLPRGLRLNHRTGVISGRVAHSGPTHTITIVAETKGRALLTAAPMKLSLKR